MATTNTCKKCGCQDSFMPSPAPCPTPIGCPTPQPCSEVFDAQCVVYTGAEIKCDNRNTIVATNDNVAEALQNIVDYFCTEVTIASDLTCGEDLVVEADTTVTNAIINVVEYFCNNTPPPNPGFTYEIGQYVPAQGGVIFHRYIDNGVQNYLVVAISDSSTSVAWDPRPVPPQLNVDSTWDGSGNTQIINSSITPPTIFSTAAYFATNNTSPSMPGWYLPAIDELNLLYNNRFNVNRTLSGNSSYGVVVGADELMSLTYWSSTESPSLASNAFYFIFGGGNNPTANKGTLASVRAVRKFNI
jgi:hypothetical protein